VADTYDSLVARRPYKQPMAPDKALAILEKEGAAGQLDRRLVDLLKKIIPEIPEVKAPQQVTAGFMKDIEVFRSKTYFREPLTDFYNYRYLYFLDDARLLRNHSLPFDLFLIDITSFGEFQQQTGHVVADQVLDELGHRLLKSATDWGRADGQPGGVVMLFRKGQDYVLYGEFTAPEQATSFLRQLRDHLDAVHGEWGLITTLYHRNFPAGFPMDKALADLFAAPTEGETKS